MVEERVVQLVCQANKPFSVQTITDNLAQYGIKKSQVQKAVDSLAAEGGRVISKEFGKTKLYFPSQDGSAAMSPQETDMKKSEHAQLAQQMSERAERVNALKSGLQALRSCMSLEDIETRIQKLQPQVEADEQKLMCMQTGTELILPEERQKVEAVFAANMEHWQKRRKIFKAIWGSVSENIDRKSADIYEEIGVEAEDAEDWRLLSVQMPNKRRKL